MSEEIRKKILVVDDEPYNMDLMDGYLSFDYEIISAFDGKEAIEKVQSEKPDLILLDIMMPDISGYEVCKILKTDHETNFIPIVLVTALTGHDEKIIGMEAGADDFLTKPVDKLELKVRIRSLLRIKEMHDEQERANQQIKASLKEKEILLREIHHRVKNNLQVISSLLNMHARSAKDPETIDILNEARNRVNTMGLIHAQLYEGRNLSEINIKRFVEGLLDQLFKSYSMQGTKIETVVDVIDYSFPTSMAVPVGLIINELFTNSIKHAFINKKEGIISISLNEPHNGKITMIISDNGVGLDDGFDIDKTRSLGLRLVKILTEEQLHSTFDVVSNNGTTFTIELKVINNEDDD